MPNTISKYINIRGSIAGTSLTSRELEVLIEDLLKTTGLQQDFEFLSNVQDDRTHFGQLKVLHKDSNIVCVLNFSTGAMFLQSEKATKIIRDYMSLHPMCKLFSSIVLIRNSCNDFFSNRQTVDRIC